MTMDRRAFLATAPLLFGFRAQEATESDWIDAGLARAKATGRWAVLLGAPEDPGARFKLGQALWALGSTENGDGEAHALLCQAVWIAVTPATAKARFPGATRQLLGPDGARLAADAANPDVFAGQETFLASFRPFLHGPSNERLLDRATAIEKGLAAEARGALDRLGAASDEERRAAAAALAPEVEKMTPLLARLAALDADERRRGAARRLLSSYAQSRKDAELGFRLPYGCSGPHYWSVCPACGRGSIPPRQRYFLRFLTLDPDPKRDRDE